MISKYNIKILEILKIQLIIFKNKKNISKIDQYKIKKILRK